MRSAVLDEPDEIAVPRDGRAQQALASVRQEQWPLRRMSGEHAFETCDKQIVSRDGDRPKLSGMLGVRVVRELESTHPHRQRWNLNNEKMDTTAGASGDLTGVSSDEDALSLGPEFPTSEAPRVEAPVGRLSEPNRSPCRRRPDPLRSASGSVQQADIGAVMSLLWKVRQFGHHIDTWITASVCGKHFGRARARLRRRGSHVFDVPSDVADGVEATGRSRRLH